MNKLKLVDILKYLAEFILMIILYRLFEQEGIKKYAVAIAVSVLFFLLTRKTKWDGRVFVCVALSAIAYLVIGSICGVFHGTYQISTVKVILYEVSSLMTALSLFIFHRENMYKLIDVQLFASCLAYLSFTWYYMITRMTRVESTFAFIFGLFAIYYAYRKRWGMFLFAGIFMYLSDKRIVILGVLIALLVILVMNIFRNNKKLAAAIWAGVTALVYLYLYMIYSGFMEKFCWGANINTNGRVEIYSRMANEFDFSLGYLGNGIGIVEHLLKCWNISEFANLHNDLLKLYIELGFLGLLIYMVSYWVVFQLIDRWFDSSKMSFFLGISVYSMLLFTTDNVSIYIMYLFTLYCICFTVLSADKLVKKKGMWKKIYDQENNSIKG